MPVISFKMLFKVLRDASMEPRADLALLLLSNSSALLALHTPAFLKSSTTTSNSLLDDLSARQSLIECKRTGDRVIEMGRIFMSRMGSTGLVDVPMAPLVIDSCYQSTVVFKYLANETGLEEWTEITELFRVGLGIWGRRWRLAGELILILNLKLMIVRDCGWVSFV